MEGAMQRKWITWLKTLGLVLLVAYGINFLFVGAIVLADYDRLFGTSVWRAVLLGVAFVIVRLWLQRDHAAPPLWEQPQWLEGKPDRKLAMRLLVALIAVSGFTIYLYLAQHQQQREAMTPAQHQRGLTFEEAMVPRSRARASQCEGLTDDQMDRLSRAEATGVPPAWDDMVAFDASQRCTK
jgi:membrane protease YdiL (CAAX protease family)